MVLFQAGSPGLCEAQVSAANINLAGQVGFLGGNVKNGQVSLTAAVQIPLQSAGQIRLSDLQSDTVGDLVPQLTDAGSAVSASLPFSASLGVAGQAGPALVSGTISVPPFDPFSGSPTVSVTGGLSPFLNASAQNMSGLLAALPAWANSLTSSSGFSLQVPLANVNLGSLVDLQTALGNAFASACPTHPASWGLPTPTRWRKCCPALPA